MFKPINSHSATNDAGVMVSVGNIVRYKHGERVMDFSATLSPALSEEYSALFNVYTPASPRWEAPYEAEPVDTRMVTRHVIEALHALNCEVEFTVA